MSFSFLIVLPKLMRSGRRAGGQRQFDLGHRGGVEAGAQPRKQIEDLRRRIRLDGVEHARVGQRVGEAQIVLAHDVEIDDEARAVFVGCGRGTP